MSSSFASSVTNWAATVCAWNSSSSSSSPHPFAQHSTQPSVPLHWLLPASSQLPEAQLTLDSLTLADLGPLLFMLTVPHVMYAIAWLQPRTFRTLLPYQWFPTAALTWKALTLLSVTALAQPRIKYSVESFFPPAIALGVLLGAMGQYLNLSVYKALGVSGVYYGRELGAVSSSTPFVTGFPFTLPHPQYLGSCLSILGLCCVFGCSATAWVPAVWFVGAYGVLLYMLTILIENIQVASC